jgi:SAM-dependent methyltransferase
MIARLDLPAKYQAWNERWGAPIGRRTPQARAIKVAVDRLGVQGLACLPVQIVGPFAFQENSITRRYEYPWAYEALRPSRGMRLLELGGGLSGLQFVLARAGCEVHNVDPLVGFGSSRYSDDIEKRFDIINRRFGGGVHLHRGVVTDIDLSRPFDAIYSVSTIEHLSKADVELNLLAAKRLLAPGGRFVLTVDLFLNLAPFSKRAANIWGTNIEPAWIEEVLQMRLVEGNRRELYGYAEFSAEYVLEHLEQFLIHSYPQLAQLMVFER